MKNIHILPTNKPSKLYYFTANKAGYYLYPNNEFVVPRNPNCINQNIFITNDEDIKKESIVKIPCGVGRVKELHWKYGNDFPSYIVEDIFTYKLRYGQKEGELQTNSFRYEDVKKIILTTDVDLIQNGVQKIDDEFLEWFVKNPSCERVNIKRLLNCTGECGICDNSCGWEYEIKKINMKEYEFLVKEQFKK